MDHAEIVHLAGGQTGLVALLGAAMGLGLRQGLDWHHAVAIADVTGMTGMAGATGGSAEPSPRVRGSRLAALRMFGLAAVYSLGHAAVVLVLGAAALLFRETLPAWLEPVVERLVGLLLLILGSLLAYSVALGVATSHPGAGNRLALVRRAWRGATRRGRQLVARLAGRAAETCPEDFHVHPAGEYAPYGARAALGTGVVHGLGAETAPQVLMLAAAGSASGGPEAAAATGAGLLLAFVAGMLVSNAGIALATTLGFVSARRARVAYALLGGISAVASLWVGMGLLFGMGDAIH